VELNVPVSKLLVGDNKRILHTLAAKALITDREDGKHYFSVSDPHLETAYIEQDIIRLGTTYSLTSRHTSFVAVNRRPVDPSPSSKEPASTSLGRQETVSQSTESVTPNFKPVIRSLGHS
jgi:hypothetical protein